MATRKFLFLNATEGLPQEQGTTDELTLAKLTLSGVSGVAVDFGGLRATNAATPTTGTDLVNKDYVDALANGLDYKASVRAATTGAVTLTGGAPNAVDGVTLALNDRILVKDQAGASGPENGIYVVTTVGTGANGTWARASDADTSAEVTGGMSVWVNEGTINGDTGWTLSTNDAIVLGTTSLVFTQTTGLGQITPGTGLTKTGNTLNVGAGNGILANADDVAIKLHTTSGMVVDTNGLRVASASADRVTINAATIDVAGVPSLFKIGGVVTSSNVTAANLNTLTGGGATTLHTHAYQPLDADLTAIAALGATAGFLKKTGADAWTIDTSTYALDSALTAHLNDTTDAHDASAISFDGTGATYIDLSASAQAALIELDVVLGNHLAGGTHKNISDAITGSVHDQGEALYISASNTVSLAAANSDTASRVIGVADGTGGGFVSHGRLDGITNISMTPGTEYFLPTAGGNPVVYSALASGDWVVCLGTAITSSSLMVNIQRRGKKA